MEKQASRETERGRERHVLGKEMEKQAGRETERDREKREAE